jgi:predicted DNA-binding antitoxin AbrB/MazE fold protein
MVETYGDYYRGATCPMLSITATYREGVFQPKEPVELPDDTEVRVLIEPILSDRLTVGKLNAFLQSLPSLGDDADDFAQDVRAIRAEFPAEMTSWD